MFFLQTICNFLDVVRSPEIAEIKERDLVIAPLAHRRPGDGSPAGTVSARRSSSTQAAGQATSQHPENSRVFFREF